VEFLGETYYHSLSMLYDHREYREQVRQHSAMIQAEFGQRPKVLRNTELLYSDELGKMAADMGFDAVLAEGLDDILGWRSPNFLYRVPEKSTRILLKNYKLSDDIAFRFTSAGRDSGGTLRADLFAGWVHSLTDNADIVGLFLDYETFGEHHTENTGIFDFLATLPAEILKRPEWSFQTPSTAVGFLSPAGDLSFPRVTSWADTERDASAWCGNKMQEGSLARVYAPREIWPDREIYSAAMEDVRETWRRLQTSDHLYYMSTKGLGDGVVHSYFSPFESPYDAFIAYNNVLKDLSSRSQRQGVPLKLGQAV
jgi:alpha-amylase